MMKKLFILLIAITLISVGKVASQEQGKIRVGANLGLGFPRLGFGLTGDYDIRYNVLDNANIGIKGGFGAMVRDVEVNNAQSTMGMVTHMSSHFLVHGDYYYNDGSSMYAPFIGGGLGNFKVFDYYLESAVGENKQVQIDPSGYFENVFGGMLRAGFELGRLRLAAEYYIIPKTTLYNEDLTIRGLSRNNYLNLNLSFYLGGGRWRKR